MTKPHGKPPHEPKGAHGPKGAHDPKGAHGHKGAHDTKGAHKSSAAHKHAGRRPSPDDESQLSITWERVLPPGFDQAGVLHPGDIHDERMQAGRAQPRSRPARRRPSHSAVIRRLAIGVFAFVSLVFAYRVITQPTLPDSVLGVWYTEDARYADRRFELREHRLVLQVSDTADAISGHEIVSVRKTELQEGTLFKVEYVLNGWDRARLSFDFIFRRKRRPEIMFAHQKDIVWTHAPHSVRAIP